MAAKRSVEIVKDILIRLRGCVAPGTDHDGVLYGDSWDQRFTMVKGFRPRAAGTMTWDSFVSSTMVHYDPTDQNGQRAIGWFAAVDDCPPNVVAADYFEGFKNALVRRAVESKRRSTGRALSYDERNLCATEAYEHCRGLIGIVVSRMPRNELGCDVLKTEWNAFSYCPERDDLESMSREFNNGQEHPPAKKHKASHGSGAPQVRGQVLMPQHHDAPNNEFESTIHDIQERVATNVTLQVHGGTGSALFLAHKGGSDMERGMRRFNELEEAAWLHEDGNIMETGADCTESVPLGHGKRSSARSVKPECTSTSKSVIKEKKASGQEKVDTMVKWREECVTKAKENMVPIRLQYSRYAHENRLLRKYIGMLQAAKAESSVAS